MAAVLALLGVAVALLVRQFLLLRRLRTGSEQMQKELDLAAKLAGAVSGADWQQSVEGLTDALVQSGVCRAACLMSLSEDGHLELRASAYAPHEVPFTFGGEETASLALKGQEPMAFGSGEWLLPIVEEREPVGLLAVRTPRTDSSVLQVAVKLAALGLTGMRLYQRQAILSNTDGLTGLANHRHFQSMLGVAIAQSYLEGEPLAVILLDIDHFKSVNDTYGHLQGDMVLRELAHLLRCELPADALAARYGGEELVVLLRGKMAQRAPEVSEHLREAIANRQMVDITSGSQIRVTVSLGVAQYELGQGKNRLVARADEALYTSKREGRNRVTVAPPENSTSHLFPS